MKRRIIIISFIVLIAISIVTLYQTLATDSTVLEDNTNVYNISLKDNNEVVEVPAKSSKTVLYQVCNTNKGKVQYGVGYITDNTDITVKEWHDSKDSASGIFDYGDNVFVKLKISNNSNKDAEVTLSTVLGFEKGGDLIPLNGEVLVTEKIKEHNYLIYYNSAQSSNSYFLGSMLTREQIGSVTFTNDNIAPDNMTGVDVSKDKDGTVMMWYGEANEDNLYDVYIGSDNKITSIYSGYHLFSNLINAKSIEFSDVVETSNVKKYGCNVYYV